MNDTTQVEAEFSEARSGIAEAVFAGSVPGFNVFGVAFSDVTRVTTVTVIRDNHSNSSEVHPFRESSVTFLAVSRRC